MAETEFRSDRRTVGRPFSVAAILVAPLLVSCSNVKFDPKKGAAEELAALCGFDVPGRNGPQITSPPSNQIVGPEIAVEGTCTGAGNVALSGRGLNAPMAVACVNGHFRQTLRLSDGDGIKDLNAVQEGVDGIGLRCVTLDTIPPRVAVEAPPRPQNMTTLTVSGTCESGLEVEVSESGNANARQTTGCVNGRFSTPLPASAGDGGKNVLATQTDPAGNRGQSQGLFEIDTVAPVVRIEQPLANAYVAATAMVTGTCESGLAVALSGSMLATPTFTVCSQGRFSASIAVAAVDGALSVVAEQTDAAGNNGRDQRQVLRDLTPPRVTITAPAAGTVAVAGLTVLGNCVDGLPVQISGAGVATPRSVNCTSGTFSAAITFTAGDGAKTVMAAQTDPAGNTGSDSRTFVRDGTAPAVRITSPASGTVGASGLTVAGTCETGLTVNLSGGIAGASTPCMNGQFSAAVVFSAGDGGKTVTAAQTDAVGNTGSDSRTFVRDSSGPAVLITSPAAGTVSSTGLTVAGSCETGLAVALTGSIANVTVACASGQFSAAVVWTAGDGNKTVQASQTDAQGNTGSDSRTFVRDGTAPAVRIISPASGTVSGTGLTVAGTCETGLAVDLSGGITSVSTVCLNGQFTAAVTWSGADGSKTVVAAQMDIVGNVGTDSRAYIKDATPPAVTITSPANGSAINASFTLTGTCEAGLSLVLSGDLVSPPTVNCTANGTYAVALAASAGNGVKQVIVAQTDLAGNTGGASASYVVASRPTAVESFTADGSEGKVDILFIDDNSASMEFEQDKLGQRFPSFVASLIGLDWQIGITTTDCSTGPWGICGSLLDMAGGAGPILTAGIANYASVFANTISRPETVDCVLRGACPSGNEEGLRAAISSMDKRGADNAGFFRTGAALAIVILSDEDEQSTGPAAATQPQAVVDRFRQIWPQDKQLRTYAITVLEGDTGCLQMQQSQQNGIGSYGTFPVELARLTGGSSQSICTADYSGILKQIGDDLRTVTSAVALTRTPLSGSVVVSFQPAQGIGWSLSGRNILFNSPVPKGTLITVTYEY